MARRRGSIFDFTVSKELNSGSFCSNLDPDIYLFEERASVSINRGGIDYNAQAISFTKTSGRCFDLAVADTGGFINLFDTRHNSKEIRNVIGWQQPISNNRAVLLAFDVCMTKEDTQLLTATSDTTVKVWDIPNQNCVGLLRGHTGFVTSICPNAANEDIIVSGSMDGSIRLWDLRCKSNVVAEVRIPSKYVVDIAHNYHESPEFDPVPMIVTSVLWLKDPVRIATAGLNDRIKIWDTRCLRQDVSDSCPQPIEEGMEHGILSLSQDDCGVLLCAGGKNRRVHIYNTIQLDKRPVLSSEGGPTNCIFLKAAISPDASNIVYGATGQRRAYVWQVDKLQEQPTVLNLDLDLEGKGGVTSVKWSHSENAKFATAGANIVRVWDKRHNQ